MSGLADTLVADLMGDSELIRPSALLADHYLKMIEQRDPRVNAILKLNPRAWEQAQLADQRRAAGDWRLSPLDGVPVVVKDNIDTTELGCSAGSRVLERAAPPVRDAAVVRMMRSLGMVLLGKTNLSEWGNFRSTRSVEGWSGLGGQTLNPHDTDRSPGGSSSGSAAAVASGMAPLAIGTETDGSIITPAALNGVVGVKPERGLLPLDGVVPVAPSQDVVGVFAARVAHATLLVAELCGRPSMAEAAVPADPRTLRLGACTSREVPNVALEQAVAALRSYGVHVVDVDVSTSAQLAEDALTATYGEFVQSLPRYLSGRAEAPADFASLVAANRADPVELSLFGQEVFDFATGLDADELAYAAEAAKRARRSARECLDRALAKHRVAALLAPANALAERLASDVPTGGATISTLPASAGYPNITLPITTLEGLPLGVCAFGPSKLAALLPVAALLERVCPAFRLADLN